MPVQISQLLSELSVAELAGFWASVICSVYGCLMIPALIRKWYREEVLYRESRRVLAKGDPVKIANKINSVTL